jgi:hypothetical protein
MKVRVLSFGFFFYDNSIRMFLLKSLLGAVGATSTLEIFDRTHKSIDNLQMPLMVCLDGDGWFLLNAVASLDHVLSLWLRQGNRNVCHVLCFLSSPSVGTLKIYIYFFKKCVHVRQRLVDVAQSAAAADARRRHRPRRRRRAAGVAARVSGLGRRRSDSQEPHSVQVCAFFWIIWTTVVRCVLLIVLFLSCTLQRVRSRRP